MASGPIFKKVSSDGASTESVARESLSEERLTPTDNSVKQNGPDTNIRSNSSGCERFEYSGWVYHLGINKIGHEQCHFRILSIRGKYVEMYKRDPHENPGIVAVKEGLRLFEAMVSWTRWNIRYNHGYEDKFTIENGFPTFVSHRMPYIFGTLSLEFPRLIKIHVDDGSTCDRDERTLAAQPDLVSSLREWVKGRFGETVDSDNGPAMMQSCMYPMTPDKDFVIDFLSGEFGQFAVWSYYNNSGRLIFRAVFYGQFFFDQIFLAGDG